MRILDKVVRRYFEKIPNEDRKIHEEDWDNLIILDACRYDLFEEALSSYELPGELNEYRSIASATPEFLTSNFKEGDFHDVVYITANPYVNTDLADDKFHDIIPVWKKGWDEELQVVTPETMLEYTLEAAENYPNKRLISHFTQPHAPFIGEKKLGERKTSNIRRKALNKKTEDPKNRNPTPFEMLAKGEITKDEIWNAYLSNLKLALPPVEELLEELDGLSVVSSDHGNALGEFAKPFPVRVYGHPMGIHIPALIRVPWHVYLNGERREIESEKPKQIERIKNEDVEERLRMLGYR